MAYQKDISAILGLSISTVSKALKGYPDVSEETRRKVLQTAEEIDYKCRGSGEKGSSLNMAPRKAGAIGILLPGCGSVVKNSLFYRRLICGIIEEAAERNADAVVMDSDTERGSMSCIGKIAARKLDGVCLLLSRRDIYDGRFAELFETTGVSSFATFSSRALISSFFIFTAQKVKSICLQYSSISSVLYTTIFLTYSGIGRSIFQRPATASSYVLPAELGDAQRATHSNQG